MASVNWDELCARWDEQERAEEAFRQRSPIHWWLTHRLTAHLWAAWRWLRGLPWWLLALRRRLRQGFWDRDTWSLDASAARYMLPRLRRLRDLQQGHPGGVTEEEWEWILHEIEEFLKWHADGIPLSVTNDEYERRGALFGKYFGALWW